MPIAAGFCGLRLKARGRMAITSFGYGLKETQKITNLEVPIEVGFNSSSEPTGFCCLMRKL